MTCIVKFVLIFQLHLYQTLFKNMSVKFCSLTTMSLLPLAGSAIKQGVGQLVEWDQWKPSPGSMLFRWLIIAGAMDPPKSIIVSKRRFRDARNGAFLKGIKHDVKNVEDIIDKLDLGILHNTIRDLEMETEVVKKRIVTFFEKCEVEKVKPVLYYTGHGQILTGDWCFANGKITIQVYIRKVKIFHKKFF